MSSRARLLTEFLAAHRPAPFAWSTANCCHFAAAWAARVLGRDPMSGLPVTADARSARRLLVRMGGLADAWSQQLGIEPVNAVMARLGDLVLLPVDAGAEAAAGAAMGICAGRTALHELPGGGIAHAPMTACTLAWRLP